MVGSLHSVHEALREHGICFVPQELTVAADLTVAENILAGEWLGRFGLVDHAAGEAVAQEALSA